MGTEAFRLQYPFLSTELRAVERAKLGGAWVTRGSASEKALVLGTFARHLLHQGNQGEGRGNAVYLTKNRINVLMSSLFIIYGLWGC